jgi:hypothetical protein
VDNKSLSQTSAASRYGRPPRERFWAKVQIGAPALCWPWMGGKNERGAGLFGAQTGGRHMVQSHRYAWQITQGEIPEGMHVLHTCDNPACCNPDHLWLGTHADNMADMKAKGRGRNGHTFGYRAKLSAEQVREIRARWRDWPSWAALGRHYGVHEKTVRSAALYPPWRNVA